MADEDFRATAISGSITRNVDGKSYLVAGANVTISSGSQYGNQIEISSTGGGGGGNWTLNAPFLYPNTPATTTVIVGGTSAATADILLAAGGGAVFNQQSAAQDFRVETVNKTSALLVSGNNDQVLINSGGAGSSIDESSGADVSFYVSGSKYTQSSATRGTAVFGGDTLVSGTLHIQGTAPVSSGAPNAAIVLDSPGESRIVWDTQPDNMAPDASIWAAPGQNLILSGGSGVRIFAGPTQDMYLHCTGSEVVVNDQSKIINFRAESNNLSHALFVDATNDRVGVGTPAPVVLFEAHSDATATGVMRVSQNFNDTDASQLEIVKGRGTGASPTAVNASDFLGTIDFKGYDGSSYETFGDIYVQAKPGGTISAGSHPGEMVFRTVRDTTTTKEEKLKITGGGVIINDNASTTDFRVGSSASPGMVLVDGGADQALFGTNSVTAASEIVPLGADIKLYLSGTSGSMGTATKGTILVAGDLVVSGASVMGGTRQKTPVDGLALEVSGSVMFGSGHAGIASAPSGITIPTYFSSKWPNATHTNEPAWLALGNAGTDSGRSVPYSEFVLVAPFDCTLRNMKISMSGSGTNTISSPGNVRFDVFHGKDQKMDSLSVAGLGAITSLVTPIGFGRSNSTVSFNGVHLAGGQTLNVPLNVSMSAGERVCISMDPLNAPSSGLWDISGVVLFEMNQFREFN